MFIMIISLFIRYRFFAFIYKRSPALNVDGGYVNLVNILNDWLN